MAKGAIELEMVIYHYCAIAQTELTKIDYYDGIVGFPRTISTKEDYAELKQAVRDAFKIGGNIRVTIISLSILEETKQ